MNADQIRLELARVAKNHGVSEKHPQVLATLGRVPLDGPELVEIARPVLPDLGAVLRPPEFEDPNFERALNL